MENEAIGKHGKRVFGERREVNRVFELNIENRKIGNPPE